jgi:hypothetical protein
MIFSTVKPTFLETVGRQRASTFAELDTLICKYTGPTAFSDNVPIVGSYHPQYPGMQAQSVRKVGDVAAMTVLEITYKGKLEAKTSNFVGAPLLDISANEQELTYQTQATTLALVIALPTSGTDPQGHNFFSPGEAQWKLYTRSWVLHYMGQATTMRYVCRPRPTAPLFQSKAVNKIIWSTTRFAGDSSATYVFGTTTSPNLTGDNPFTGVVFNFFGPQLYCSTFNAVSVTPDWYQVTETWVSKFFVT